jgi:3-oxoacyl-(acyl-carrier-protein) synthase
VLKHVERRVVVTGLGHVSALGAGRAVLVDGLTSGRIATGPLRESLATVPPGRGGLAPVGPADYKNWFDTRVLRLATMTRQTTLGCVACGDLLAEAGYPADNGKYPERGAYLGSFIVPPDYAKQVRAMRMLAHRPDGEDTGFVLDDTRLAEAMKLASAFDFLRALPNMPSSHLSIQAGSQGPTCTYLGSDASGMQAIVMAVGAIRSGIADAMIAGGAFCPMQEVHLLWQGQRGLWAAAGEAVRPYARGRSGTLPGEGAALLYLEERESALRRGAKILAEVTGAAQRILPGGPGTGTSEADEVDVRAETLRAAWEGPLSSPAPVRGGGSPAPQWLAPSGLGHPDLDRRESAAFSAAFGGALEGSAAVTVVPQVGFLGTAASPLNLVAALLAARGEAAPARSSIEPGTGDDAPCAALASALGRTARSGPGTTVLGAAFSLDGVHAALSLRVE